LFKLKKPPVTPSVTRTDPRKRVLMGVAWRPNGEKRPKFASEMSHSLNVKRRQRKKKTQYLRRDGVYTLRSKTREERVQ